jgi:hypothetical protein
MPEDPDGGDTSRWDPFGLRHLLLPSAAQVAQVAQVAGPLAMHAGNLSMLGGRTALQGLLGAVRARLVGRRITFGSGADALTLTLDDVAADADPLLLAVGQLGDVSLTATQVQWRDFEFVSARATAHNAHTRPGIRPLLIAAPVDLVMSVSDDQLSPLVAERSPRVELQITDDARVVARLRRHPTWGWVEVEPSVEGRRMMFRPVRVGTPRKASRILPALPHVHFAVPLGDGFQITRLEVGSGSLDVHVRMSEWRLDYLDALSFINSK